MAKTVKLENGEEVVCQPLTFGYIYDVENDIIKEEIHSMIIDATDLTLEDIRKIGRPDIFKLKDAITMETYPEAYDESGKPKLPSEQPINEEDEKKN